MQRDSRQSVRRCQIAILATLIALPPFLVVAEDQFKNQNQVERLNAVLGDQAGNPVRLREVSRLLAEPVDQALWLVVRAELLDQGESKAAARELADLAEARIDAFGALGVSELKPLRDRLKEIGKTPPVDNKNDNVKPEPPPGRLVDITDPQQLAARVANPAAGELEALSPTDKALLWARRDPNGRLGINTKGKIADWDMTRNIVFDLGLGKDHDGAAPFNFVALLAKQEQLRTARNAARSGPPFADAAGAVTAELLSLAMGLGSSAAAGSAAATLENQGAWAWAALARIAEAAAPGAARGEALRKAREHLKAITLVRDARPDGGAHIATIIEKWISRVEGGGGPSGGDSISSFDSGAINARRDRKRELARQCASAAPGDQKFKLMQQAKAAEVDFDSAPGVLSIEELKNLLRNPQVDSLKPGMHLFLELLEVEDGSFIGFALGSTTGGRDAKDDFFPPKWLGPASAESVLSDAIKLVKGGAIPNEAMVIVAPDGAARSAGWSGEAVLKNLLKDDAAWVLYVPTAAAMKKGTGWKAIDALRYWYFAGNNMSSISVGLSGASVRPFKSPWLDSNMGLIVIGLGAEVRDFANPSDFCKRLMKAKREGRAVGVFAVGFSK